MRAHPAAPHEVGQAVREDSGLARTGSGQDQERPPFVKDGFTLLVVKVFGELGVQRSDLGHAFGPIQAVGLRCGRGVSLAARFKHLVQTATPKAFHVSGHIRIAQFT
jgi:hypothetical protein